MTQPTPTLDYAYDPRPRRFGRGIFAWVLFIGLAVMLFLLLKSNQRSVMDLALSDFKNQLLTGNVREVSISSDELTGTFGKPPRFAPGMTRFRVALPQGMGAQWSFTQWILDNNVAGATVSADNSYSIFLQTITPFIPWLLIFGFLWFFIFRHFRNTKPGPVQVIPPPANAGGS